MSDLEWTLLGACVAVLDGRFTVLDRDVHAELLEHVAAAVDQAEPPVTFAVFKVAVKRHGWSLADLRCDKQSPSPALLTFMDRCPKYEEFTLRLEKEGK